jgi:hypothetical protein
MWGEREGWILIGAGVVLLSQVVGSLLSVLTEWALYWRKKKKYYD